MGCLQLDLSLFNFPTEAKQWTLAANKSGEWFRRVEEAAEQYMKPWFVRKAKMFNNDERLRYKMHRNLKRRRAKCPGGRGRGAASKGA